MVPYPGAGAFNGASDLLQGDVVLRLHARVSLLSLSQSPSRQQTSETDLQVLDEVA